MGKFIEWFPLASLWFLFRGLMANKSGSIQLAYSSFKQSQDSILCFVSSPSNPVAANSFRRDSALVTNSCHWLAANRNLLDSNSPIVIIYTTQKFVKLIHSNLKTSSPSACSPWNSVWLSSVSLSEFGWHADEAPLSWNFWIPGCTIWSGIPFSRKGRELMAIAIRGIVVIGVIRTFATGRLQIFAALTANFKVFRVSSRWVAEGERHTIIKVKALPPNESYKLWIEVRCKTNNKIK